MKRLLILIIASLMVFVSVSCSTTKALSVAVPEIGSDDAFLDLLIDTPVSIEDVVHNSLVYERLYVNQKENTLVLLAYISDLAGDKKKQVSV
jgi:hypothetical protein